LKPEKAINLKGVALFGGPVDRYNRQGLSNAFNLAVTWNLRRK
jgi:hypothetical protein